VTHAPSRGSERAQICPVQAARVLRFERERFADEALRERAVTEPEVREPAKQSVLGSLLRRKVSGFCFELLKSSRCCRQVPLVECGARSVEASPAGAAEEHSSG
jgi:hypothetical protein